MTIDIHSLLGKNSITRNILKPKFGYRYCGPYNNLNHQIDYNKYIKCMINLKIKQTRYV